MSSTRQARVGFGQVRFLDLLLVCLLGGIVVLAVAKLLFPHRPSPFSPNATLENYRRIHIGMSQTDVEAILGQGTDNTPTPANDVFPRVHFRLEERFRYWASETEDIAIDVHLLDGKVVHKRLWTNLEITDKEPAEWDCEWDRVQRELQQKRSESPAP